MSYLRKLAQVVSVHGTRNTLPAGLAQKATYGSATAAHHGNPHDYVTYAGLTLKKPSPWEYYGSKLLGATMWFWIFTGIYNNYEAKVYGLAYIFDKEGDDEEHHH